MTDDSLNAAADNATQQLTTLREVARERAYKYGLSLSLVRDAAPDLLAAAKQVVAWADPIAICAPELGAAQTAFYNLRLAIAKAEGTT